MADFPEAGFEAAIRDIGAFADEEGRRPRMLVVKLSQDGDDRGARAFATGFAEIGFDVDVGPLFQSPEEAARQAVENDVHVVCVSTEAEGHKTLVPALLQALKTQGADDILVVTGSAIPPEDHPMLRAAGVTGIYQPGADIPAAATEILGIIRDSRTAA